MAESVVKLRVDSNEYESKIKRAAQNVLDFGQNCQKAGQSVAKADKETLEYVQAIGQMETVSKNAKGKINEMTTAFTDLSVQYRHLTDQEKQSPFGKALAQSLDQLRQRINDSKSELNDVNRSLQDTSSQGEQTGGIMQQLASKFTLNVDVMKVFNLGMKTVGVALDVAKDAFFSNESQVDEWGRTVEAGESVYRAFVNALNSSNFSGFFSRIDGIIQKAREAYDAMDRLNTVMTIINPERAKLQARQQQLRETIRREGKDSAAGKQAQQELINLEPKLKSSYKTEAGLNYNAFDKLVRERLAEGGIKLDDKSYKFLMSTFSDENAFRKLEQFARGSRQYVPGQSFTTSWGASYNSGRWVDTRNTNKKLLDLFTDEWRQKNSPYLTAAFGAIGSAASVGLQNTRYVTGGGGGGVGRTGGGGGGGANTPPPPPAGSIAEQEAKVQALTKAWREATDEVGRAGYAGMLEEAKQVLDQMQGKTQEVIPEGSFKDLKNQLGDLQKQRELLADPIEVAIIDTDIERVKDRIDELNGKLKEVANTEPISLEDKIRTSISDDKINADMQALTNLLRVKIENGLDDLDINTEGIQQAIFGEGIDIPDSYWQDLAEKINAKLKELGIDPIAIDVQTGNVSKEEKQDRRSPMDTMRAAMGGISQIAGGLNQMGVKLPESINKGISVMQGVITVIEGVQTVISLFSSSSQALNTAAVMANTIALGALTTAMTVNTATNFIPFFNTGGIAHAAGGLLAGHHFSGDNVPVMVNDGELILNRAQQGNLASQLESEGGLSNLHLEAKISAESLRILLNSNSRRRGRGEYVTTKG